MITAELPECYQNLVNAIIMRAVRDYRRALRGLRKHPQHEPYIWRKKEVEVFFRSQWFKDLCNINGEMLIKKLQKEVMCT